MRQRIPVKKLLGKQKKELGGLALLPDSRIDLTDIPEIVDWSEAVVGKFYRPDSTWQQIPMRVARVKRRKR
jgi:hypothetical protein